MGLVQLKCPACGADKLEARTINGAPGYFCAHCGKEFYEEIGIREYEKLEAVIKSGLGSVVDEALLREKMEKYYNLRSLLWSKITAKYIDSAAIVGICRDILAIAQHDFLAEFFEVANSGTTEEIAQYISTINEKENSALVDLVLDFIIKSLEEPYVTPTAALLDRCGRIFSPEKKQEYLTRFEAEAAKVADGLYVTSVDRDVFLAYSGKDMPAVVDVLNFIESQGLSCFAAFRNLQHGRDAVANYDRALEDAINHCSIFVFVSSVNSRSFACDALKKEMTYIRNSEMSMLPTCRSYDQLPEKYRKLRIEYRIDNKPTPIAIEKTMRDFFVGLTYTENYDQLGIRLSECMEKIYNPTFDEEVAPPQPEQTSSSFNLADKDTLAQMLRMINEENKRAEEEAKRKAEEEAKRKAEEEAKRKAEEEAKRKAEEEAKRKAAEEAKRKAEEEAKRKAEEEAKRKAEAEVKRKAELEKNFTIEGTTLIKYIGDDSEVVIPNFITAIGEKAFYEYKNLTSVTIPESVTSIGDGAFSHCDSLVSVTIPDSVTSIGKGVFSYCSSLANVTMPDSVTSIGNSAFWNCSNLVSVTVDKGNKYYKDIDGNLYTKDGKTLLQYAIGKKDTEFTITDGVEIIGIDAFWNCSNLVSVTVDKNNKYYKDIDGNLYTKDGKTLLQYAIGKKDSTFTIPDGVEIIGHGAFWDCRSLMDVTIPDSVTSISYGAFRYCSKLTSVTIPDSVTSIGDEAFRDCKNLVIYLSPKANTSGFAENWNCGFEVVLRESEIDKNFTIENGVLKKLINTNITDIVIPSNVTSIGNEAFKKCDNLTSITIPNSVTSIGDHAFYHCDSLTNITIPSSVTSIGDSAFYHCDNLTSITIPSSVTSIGSTAFAHCKSLTSITIPSSVTSIGNVAFSSCNSLTSIIVDANNETYKSIDGNLYTKDGKTLIQYAIGKKDTSFIIPDGVTSIGSYAFYDCDSLTNITIPSSVTSIGWYAFYHCDNLTSITIPSSVTSIDGFAFAHCSSLTSITIPNSVTSIGKSAFEDCNKNLKIYLHQNVTHQFFEGNWHGGHTIETLKTPTIGGVLKKLFKK